MIDQLDIEALRETANVILRVDGDRDHTNRSDLTVKVTTIAAKMLRICADELETRQSRKGIPLSDIYPGPEYNGGVSPPV